MQDFEGSWSPKRCQTMLWCHIPWLYLLSWLYSLSMPSTVPSSLWHQSQHWLFFGDSNLVDVDGLRTEPVGCCPSWRDLCPLQFKQHILTRQVVRVKYNNKDESNAPETEDDWQDDGGKSSEQPGQVFSDVMPTHKSYNFSEFLPCELK